MAKISIKLFRHKIPERNGRKYTAQRTYSLDLFPIRVDPIDADMRTRGSRNFTTISRVSIPALLLLLLLPVFHHLSLLLLSPLLDEPAVLTSQLLDFRHIFTFPLLE
jgi:hypothetical protein